MSIVPYVFIGGGIAYPLTYRLTNRLLPYRTINGDTPTLAGVMTHTAVALGLARLFFTFKQKSTIKKDPVQGKEMCKKCVQECVNKDGKKDCWMEVCGHLCDANTVKECIALTNCDPLLDPQEYQRCQALCKI